MKSVINRQFHLVRIPDGPLTSDCFRLELAPMPEPKEGEVLLKTLYMSIDAAKHKTDEPSDVQEKI